MIKRFGMAAGLVAVLLTSSSSVASAHSPSKNFTGGGCSFALYIGHEGQANGAIWAGNDADCTNVRVRVTTSTGTSNYAYDPDGAMPWGAGAFRGGTAISAYGAGRAGGVWYNGSITH